MFEVSAIAINKFHMYFTEKAASPASPKEEPKPEAMEVGAVQPNSDSEDEDMGEDDDDDGKEAESATEEESGASSSKPSLNLAGFLFGNIDDEGKLSDDHSFLDSDTRAKLGGLSLLLGASGSEILKVRCVTSVTCQKIT